MKTESASGTENGEEDRGLDESGEIVQESGSYCGGVCVQIASLGNGMSVGVFAMVGRCYRCRGRGPIVAAGDGLEYLSLLFVAICF